MDSNKPSKPKNEFAMAKQRLASNPGTAPATLDKLSEKDNPDVAERIAENPQTPSETLEKLSNHESAEVRAAVSENINTPDEILQELSEDADPDVRFRIAENPATPTEILQTLAEDENPFIVARAQDTLKASKCVAARADDLLLKDKFVEAESLYRTLVAGLEELLGTDHREVAVALHKLAAATTGLGHEQEAAEIAMRASRILQVNDEAEKKQ